MKMYADAPTRRTLQIIRDVLFVTWVVGWVWVGGVVHDGTMALAAPGRALESSATTLRDGLTEAGDALGGVPLVGDGVAAPFEKAAGASESLAQSGRDEVVAVQRLAWMLGLSIALIPVLVIGALYIPGRVRFIREATAGLKFIDGAEDLDLFAIRALIRQPMHVLAQISDDPAGAWRARDGVVVRALAELELREVGLTPPEGLLRG